MSPRSILVGAVILAWIAVALLAIGCARSTIDTRGAAYGLVEDAR